MKKLILLSILLIVGCEDSTSPKPEDCAGIVEGTAIEDDCGICDGIDGYMAGSCYDCSGVANGTAIEDCLGVCGGCATVLENCGGDNFFIYNQSSSLAYYNFFSITIDGVLVDSDDWVGAFKGNVCVGALKWDTSQCGNGVCSLPTMGDNGAEFTAGYMKAGEIPTFKIYDTSENKLYNAMASDDIPWVNLGISASSLTAITNSVSNCP